MKLEGIAPPPKEWAWSYSKLKNYNTCPKRHYEIDLVKNYIEGESEHLTWGNAVHKALALACAGTAALPPEMSSYQRWVDSVRAGQGQLLVEQKYAITRDFRPTAYFARDCWYRGIGDVVRINGDIAEIIDWKTGKVLEDPVQLMLMATCLFAHYPQLLRVVSQYIWLKEECTTPEVFTREEVAKQWVSLLPQITALENAAKTSTYPPKPSGLCGKYCPVKSCTHHGKTGFNKR